MGPANDTTTCLKVKLSHVYDKRKSIYIGSKKIVQKVTRWSDIAI